MTYNNNDVGGLQNQVGDLQNEAKTCAAPRTPGAQSRSGFELVSYRGEIFGPFEKVSHAVSFAAMRWPDQQQDPDRTGAGWDIEVVRT